MRRYTFSCLLTALLWSCQGLKADTLQQPKKVVPHNTLDTIIIEGKEFYLARSDTFDVKTSTRTGVTIISHYNYLK